MQNHWEWLNKPFRNSSKAIGWFRSKEFGFRTSRSREMLNGVSLLVNSCLKRQNRKGVLHRVITSNENGSTTIIPSAENHGECPDMPSSRWPDRIFTVPRLCSVFGGSSSVYYELLIPSETIIIWKRWNGRSYPTHSTLQTLLLLTVICFDRWHTAWLISISALMKKWKNVSPQKAHGFFEMISDNSQKDRRN